MTEMQPIAEPLFDSIRMDDLDQPSRLAELTAALIVEANRAERLVAQLEHSVAQGDRMLAELGLAA